MPIFGRVGARCAGPALFAIALIILIAPTRGLSKLLALCAGGEANLSPDLSQGDFLAASAAGPC